MANARISEKTHRIAKELAEGSGKTLQEVLEDALEAYRRATFIEECNTAYAALQSDKEAWAAEQAERSELDNTLGDGLEGY